METILPTIGATISDGADTFFGALPASPPLALILALALLIDAIVGDPRWLYRRIPHPVVLIGKPIAFLDRRLNRPDRGKRTGWPAGR